MNMKNLPFQNAVVTWIDGKKIAIEAIMTIVMLVCLILFHAHLISGAFLMLVLMTLAGLYFLSAFLPPQTDKIFVVIASKVAGIASAVAITGILFSILAFEGAKNQLFIGMTSLGVGAVVLILGYFQLQKSWILVLIARAVLLFCLSLYYFNYHTIQ
jgi:hypothetical protein